MKQTSGASVMSQKELLGEIHNGGIGVKKTLFFQIGNGFTLFADYRSTKSLHNIKGYRIALRSRTLQSGGKFYSVWPIQ